MENDLFSFNSPKDIPLAHARRPQKFEDLVGQRHFLNEKFKKVLESDMWTGFIFWGPPGTGKTSLASVIAQITKRPYERLSAVTSNVKEIREVLERSREAHRMGLKAHILFIDEIHRLNKGQQDVLLPFIEEGSIKFIGATTENPSFEINNAISSRCVIFQFKPLSHSDLKTLIENSKKKNISSDVITKLISASNGDARRALTLLDHLEIQNSDKSEIQLEDFIALSEAQSLYYDKNSESHFDTISAFIKSIRGSDPDAAIYYLARMLEGGEDPLFIARRLIILASEDIGNANSAALMLANSCFQSVHAIGMPEARIVLAQTTTYLACSEKSNRSYKAIEAAIEVVKQTGNLEIPLHIRNAPTQLMKEWGYGKNYKYPHNNNNGWVPETYLPHSIKEMRFYEPSALGQEKKHQDFLSARKNLNKKPDTGCTI